MSSLKKNILVLLVFGFLVLGSGCSSVGTSGEGSAILPIKFGVDFALAKGPHKLATGLGASGRTIAQNESQDSFNESWSKVGVAKNENSSSEDSKGISSVAVDDRNHYRN